jgi:hypothetical protein
MSLKIAATALVVSFIVGGVAVYSYIDMREENKLLKDKVDNLEDINQSHVESGEIKNEQTTDIRTVEATAVKSGPAVARLRESAAKAPRDTVETCNRSLVVAGEVLAECSERYLEVARKAELLAVDLKAMDSHADLLEGLVSDLTGLEPLK